MSRARAPSVGDVIPVAQLCAIAVALCVAAFATEAMAQAALPRFDGMAHLGVASCAGPCHARQSALGVATGAAMRGSEVVVWQDQDSTRGRHAEAYNVLLEPRSRAIARKLGIAAPERAGECLSCHADLIPADKRGARFQLSDGVGCESCHGGAETWLTSHAAPDATHARNLADGMYPTSDIAARARLCVSCHVGAAAPDQFVTHRIMGAGHPRLSFEVELFTSLQMHHVEDADYAARKPVHGRARVWAIGQAVALRASVDLFLRSERERRGLFPELSFFDCHSCHRPISDSADYASRWTPNPARPLGPGSAPFNDANLMVLVAAARAFTPALADDLDAAGRAFHAAALGTGEERQRTGAALSAALSRVVTAFGSASLSPERTEAALRAIVAETQAERYTSYGAAEQAVMAVDSLSRALVDAGGPRRVAAERARAAIEAAYRAVDDPNTYDPAEFQRAVADIAARWGA
ncbi:MAG: multiheme c-type cytochrome [Hyphomonadaceae bacterium]|nr:multiheme c-type cytochrome [Hyphomonadaceae bacterium]